MEPADLIPYTYYNRPAARALYHALTPDPFYKALEICSFQHPDTAKQAMFRYMDYAITEARDNGRLTLAQDGTSGAAVWSVPLPPEIENQLSDRKKTFIRDHLGTKSLDAYRQIVTFMAGQTPDVVPEEAWYLSILGILPERQGEGLGKQLMMPVLNEADKQHLPVYAESFTPENFGFYSRLGFRPAKTVSEPFTGTSYTILLRPARDSDKRAGIRQ